MIQARISMYSGLIKSLNVQGHANSGPYGADLVCAGVSSIMTGALNGLDTLFPEACKLSMEANAISIAVLADSPCLQSALQLICIQLATMQEAYPDFIQLEKKEV